MNARIIVALLLLAASPGVFAKTCKVVVGSNDAMQFDTAQIKLAADCAAVELTLRHTGRMPVTAMGHNWVLTATADARAVAIAGQRAPAADQYLPADDARIIAATRLIGGGETTSVTFPTDQLRKGGDYTFFCSFPGHWNVMQGKLVFG